MDINEKNRTKQSYLSFNRYTKYMHIFPFKLCNFATLFWEITGQRNMMDSHTEKISLRRNNIHVWLGTIRCVCVSVQTFPYLRQTDQRKAWISFGENCQFNIRRSEWTEEKKTRLCFLRWMISVLVWEYTEMMRE